MSELRLETYTMPAAELGRENPLPPLFARRHAGLGERPVNYFGEAPAENIGNEHVGLPYLLQDDYTRQRSPRTFKVAVLENDILRAMFLLERGGRLWSLVHKPTGRELLHKNPVFQPGNLAIRDAWFSGGVEWNIGILGHSPFTCSPLFAARVMGEGYPILRLYEWERARAVPWQLDLFLPDGSPFLFARGKITNPHEKGVPMYWWSNIAVDETRDTRVLAPATEARRHDYDGVLVKTDVPYGNGYDGSYSTNQPNSGDIYFAIPREQRPWIAALDKQGQGLIHASTKRMLGRKMFFWGQGSGGQQWQNFLSLPGEAYIELQGGLCPTQGEYIHMPANTTWDWLEAYGMMQADPATAHGTDWQAAYGHVNARLDEMLPLARLDEMLGQTRRSAEAPAQELLHAGSGWGALDRHRASAAGEKESSHGQAAPLQDFALTAEQSPWIALLQTGALPPRNPSDEPAAPLVQGQWRELLEASSRSEAGNHWQTWYQLGLMQLYAMDFEGAIEAWKKSIALTPNAWAYRNLAVLAADEEQWPQACELYLKAIALKPALRPLLIETFRALQGAGRQAELRELYRTLPQELRNNGRLKLLDAFAALAADDLPTVEEFFTGHADTANVREGEVTTSELWFGLYEKKISRAEGIPIDEALKKRVREEFPPPAEFDFRMRTTPRAPRKPRPKPARPARKSVFS